MTIRALFTSHEKVFEEWMLDHKFNQEIEVEPRFPKVNQDEVQDSYFTVPKESPLPRCPKGEELKTIRSKRSFYYSKEEFEKREKALSHHEERIPSSTSDSISTHQRMDSAAESGSDEGPWEYQYVRKNIRYHIVHGPVVQKVEKKSSIESVQYGNFWGRTYFAVTKKQTGYFLVSGWLVVSVPKKIIEEEPFEVNDGDEITVIHKFDEGFDVDSDPVASKIVTYIEQWFDYQRGKFWIVGGTSFVGALASAVIIPLLGAIDHWAGVWFRLALIITDIALCAMGFYTCVKLYQLYCFQDKMRSINNLGNWVGQVRHFVFEDPDLFAQASRIHKFFTSREQEALLPYFKG